MYEEINELYRYCLDNNIDANIEPLYDGAKISFPNGGDFVQHWGSYRSEHGCVEPAIGCKLDYTAVPLGQAKKLVRRYKRKLNRRPKK